MAVERWSKKLYGLGSPPDGTVSEVRAAADHGMEMTYRRHTEQRP